MKRIIVIVFFFTAYHACAQKMPEMSTKVRITAPDKTIVAEINEVAAVSSPKPGLYYFWYYANGIHSTQGGYNGKLLDGNYMEYYPDKSLKEQGYFIRGLKNGLWKTWNEDGTLKESVHWKSGKVIIRKSSPFWKRLPILRKKFKHSVADSTKKTTK
ncbi:MAG: hypothetical protein JWP44_2489 [Mucilaginibacter sp.]|nr:hypothetical protein [Mucilaginibacter sp.]